MPTYRRFEWTGQISLRSLVMLAIVLAEMDDFMQIATELNLSKKRVDEILEQIIEPCKNEGKLHYKIL